MKPAMLARLTAPIPALLRAAVPAGLAAMAAMLAMLAMLALAPPALAQGVLSDKPDVQAALNRFTGGHNYASEAERARDQATLFANNDAINKARLNNEIPDTAYQAAQTDFANLNRDFAEQSAKAAGAEFTVQKSSSPEAFKPGTDSDYITVVENKGQIAEMQQGYNDRVNEFLKNNGVPEQSDTWHNKLDTDFMADPSKITDPQEFRDIAKMNNDAYKNRMAAEYEAISRAGDGRKIGPEHVDGYMQEMNDFAAKKGGKIDDMLAKGPSQFSDPAKRAELFQAMAQEQKYNSRLESLDDFLRAQEGLPPRSRGDSIAKLGSNRSPGNASNIRSAHAVSEASRMTAMENLAETMGQVAKKNPAFNPNMADDIAKIVEGLPPDRRAGVLARIKANGGPGLVDDIMAASSRAGRLPPGSSLADDMARAGSKFDDMADAFSKVDDLADAGTGRGALGKAVGALEAIGKAADALEVAAAAAQLADLFRQLDRAADPDLSPEERNELLEKIRQAAGELRDSAALGAIMQRYPAVAAIYGAWTVGCMAGEFVSASREAGELGEGSSATGTCLDRHMSAWDRAKEDIQSWWTGNPTERDAHAQALCDKFTKAVKERRITMKPDWKVLDACNFIRSGLPVGHMIEEASVSPQDMEEQPEQPETPAVTLVPAACDIAQNNGAIAGLRDAAAKGSEVAIAHIARLEAANGGIAGAQSAFDAARGAYDSGNLDAVNAGLDKAKASLDGLGGEPDCAGLAGQIAAAVERAGRMQQVLARANGALETCDPGLLAVIKEEYGAIIFPAMQAVLRQGDAITAAHARYQEAKVSFSAGDLAAAGNGIGQAQAALGGVGSGLCADLRQQINEGSGKIDRLRDAIRSAEQAVVTCNRPAMQRWRGALAKVVNPAAAAVKLQLDKGDDACKEREREEQIAAANESCKASFGEHAYADPATAASDKPQCGCKKDYRWNDGRTVCIAAPDEEKLAAERNANCRRQYGSGYYSGPVNAKGVYYCLPDKTAANAQCRKLNGPGVYAGKVRADGSFDCRRTRESQRQAALDNCRRQYGNRFIRLVRRNGQYLCEFNQGGGRQPSHSAQNSAAVIGGVIGAIGNAVGNRGGGNASNCHHRPGASTRHCGTESGRRPPARTTPTARTAPRVRPPNCVSHLTGTSKKLINHTDPRCRPYW